VGALCPIDSGYRPHSYFQLARHPIPIHNRGHRLTEPLTADAEEQKMTNTNASAPVRCKGYQSVSFARAEAPSDVIGSFYAVYPDGRVYETPITLAQYRTHLFAFRGARWVPSSMTAEQVRDTAEFNGNYAFPV
ncbi:hypothetical protein, partial [Staphylococcus aureus]